MDVDEGKDVMLLVVEYLKRHGGVVCVVEGNMLLLLDVNHMGDNGEDVDGGKDARRQSVDFLGQQLVAVENVGQAVQVA